MTQFYAKLRDIRKNGKFKDIQLEKMVPPSLMGEWNEANKAAYDLRKKKKLLTRTIIQNNSVVLLTKAKDDQRWTKINPKA